MWKHKDQIPVGKKGEISYIEEELFELKDAYRQNISNTWIAIELSDLVISVGKFSNSKLKTPLILIIILGYIRIPYKIIRNHVLDRIGVKKHSQNHTK